MKTKLTKTSATIIASLLCIPAIGVGYLIAGWQTYQFTEETTALTSANQQSSEDLKNKINTHTPTPDNLLGQFGQNQTNEEPAGLPVWPDSKLIHRSEQALTDGGMQTAIRILPIAQTESAIQTYQNQAEALGFKKMTVKEKDGKHALIMSKNQARLILEFSSHPNGLKCMMHHTWFN